MNGQKGNKWGVDERAVNERAIRDGAGEVVERKWDIYGACLVAEGVDEVESEEEYLAAWQYLVDTGVVWSLQGWYGRTAKSLIEAGQIEPARG